MSLSTAEVGCYISPLTLVCVGGWSTPSALHGMIGAIYLTYLLPRRHPLSFPSALHQPANTLRAGAFQVIRKVPPCRRSAANPRARSRIRNEILSPSTHPSCRSSSASPLPSIPLISNQNRTFGHDGDRSKAKPSQKAQQKKPKSRRHGQRLSLCRTKRRSQDAHQHFRSAELRAL